MRLLVLCFTLIALCVAVFTMAAPSVTGESVDQAVAVEQIPVGIDPDTALGPFPFPDTRCCRDTKRKDCMTPCAVPPPTSPDGTITFDFTTEPWFFDSVGYTGRLHGRALPETPRLNI